MLNSPGDTAIKYILNWDSHRKCHGIKVKELGNSDIKSSLCKVILSKALPCQSPLFSPWNFILDECIKALLLLELHNLML